MNKNIYGAIGFTLLENNTISYSPRYILILADMHSKLPYCDDRINISEWFFNNMKSTNILLEEVPRIDIKLKELWTDSDHTHELKNLFLKNCETIHAIDIRPFLVPYSWELYILNDNDKTSLQEYLSKIKNFIDLKHDLFKTKLKNVYNIDYLKKSLLGYHFDIIISLYTNYIKENKIYLNMIIADIFKKNKKILEDINDILNTIMEWFIIAKLFDLNNKKNTIIHTGLYHSEKVIIALTSIYNYKIKYKYGINNIVDADNAEKSTIVNGCIKLPKNIENQLSILN